MAVQDSLFSPLEDVDFVGHLLVDLHDDLPGKVARFRQLADLSADLGSYASMLTGGRVAYSAWVEARSSFVHGNFVATVLLCQALAEHMLASQLAIGIHGQELPARIDFRETLKRSLKAGVITDAHADELRKLMELRNPLSHYRGAGDASNLFRRAVDTRTDPAEHLLGDATFAVSVAVRLLALPAFRVDRSSLDD
ncbi:hypothetical protein [Paracidovorax avenae]|uniref:hypothetical protein n=1 Tax=Paracidovorax avenae TaxID=80867 RepID=UPI000D22B690|nr:hypothetical protein [Paracidovorax avenae]AVT01634.1 hypothetical protein C8243_03365 [Paracidovorax avenae]